MRINLNKRDIEKLFDNNCYNELINIYKSCVSNVDLVDGLTNMFYNPSENRESIIFMICDVVRNHNYYENYKIFVPCGDYKKIDDMTDDEKNYMKFAKRMKIDIEDFKKNYYGNINKESLDALYQLYEIDKNNYYIGIHRTNYYVDYIFQEGINVGSIADLNDTVQRMDNFDLMLSEISSCESYKHSNGCFIVKVPKDAINNKSEPLYYLKNECIYLNPQYVVGHADVMNRKIINVELNEQMDIVNSNIFEGEYIGNTNPNRNIHNKI